MGEMDMSAELPEPHEDAGAWLDGVDLTEVIRSGEAPEREPGRPDTRVPMQMLNARVPMDLVDALDAMAGQQRRSRSELVRQAVEEYVARCQVAAADAEAGSDSTAVAENALHTARHALEVLARVLHRKPAA
jgi:predicted transcriptional regulator